MKDVSEVVACVLDHGTLGICLAEKLAETYRKVYFSSHCQSEYHDIAECTKGDGLANVERLDEVISPETVAEIDLLIVPDIGYAGVQKYFRSIGKAVWGSMGADELELYRTDFLKVTEELGLPIIPYVRIQGVTKLADHLKTVKDKWVKVNRYRAQRETFYHLDYPHSIATLDKLAVKFGGLKEYVIFVVQDNVPDAQEIGYDGLSVDGWYPRKSFQGYEKKNESYLGSCLEWDKLPEEVRIVNEAMSPILRDYGYRNFIATEIRKTPDTFHFIDPTPRMPGQTGEQLLETCKNLAEVIWSGANGEPVETEYRAKFAAEATLHHKNHVEDEWYCLNIPDSVKRNVKLYHYCEADSLYHFPPNDCDEPGVVVGIGNTIEEAIDSVKDTLEKLKSEPVDADISAFADLLKEIKEAEESGMEFTTQEIPEPEIVLQ